MDWKYIFRDGEATFNNKQKIFIFLSHNDAVWYDKLIELFLSSFNCTICRPVVDIATVEKNSWKDINLFAVLISDYILKDGKKIFDMLFNIARENNIPVFLFRISNIDFEVFESEYGSLHVFDATSVCRTNPKERDYLVEKLRDNLFYVLGSEKEIEQIKKNFDAHFFLSYRKKDRIGVKQLLESIRSHPCLRDCAIWWDDALIPGENYQKIIESKIKESSIFLMLVTDSLSEKDNYVSRIEYPFAKQLGKPIEPFLLHKTDTSALIELLPDLPSCTDASNIQEMTNTLKKICFSLNLKAPDNTPMHLYFMGLAYLWGIGVEKNEHLSLSLLSNSAQQGYIDSWQKLGYIYANGIGVKEDSGRAITYLEKYILEYNTAIHLKKDFLRKKSLTVEEHNQCVKDAETVLAINTLLNLYKLEKTYNKEVIGVVFSICTQIINYKNIFKVYSHEFSKIVGYEKVKEEDGKYKVGNAIFGTEVYISSLLLDDAMIDSLHMLAFDFITHTDADESHDLLCYIIETYEISLDIAKQDKRFRHPAFLTKILSELISLYGLVEKKLSQRGRINPLFSFIKKPFYESILKQYYEEFLIEPSCAGALRLSEKNLLDRLRAVPK